LHEIILPSSIIRNLNSGDTNNLLITMKNKITLEEEIKLQEAKLKNLKKEIDATLQELIDAIERINKYSEVRLFYIKTVLAMFVIVGILTIYSLLQQ